MHQSTHTEKSTGGIDGASLRADPDAIRQQMKCIMGHGKITEFQSSLENVD